MINNPLNILVVDDDPAILHMFEDFFKTKQDITLMTANGGTEALKVCNRKKVDFCFTDLYMPGMGGLELARQIQHMDNTIPVVVMTGFPSMESAVATLRNGVVDFLVKPFKSEGIGRTIQHVLKQRDLFVENLVLKEEVSRGAKLASCNAELVEKTKELHVLNLILQKVDCGRSSSTLYDRIVKLCSYITGSDESFFHIFDETLGKPVMVASHCHHHQERDEGVESHVEEILNKRITEGMPFLLKDAGSDLHGSTAVRSLIAVPLKIQEKAFGMLSAVMTAPDRRCFQEKDLYYMNFLGRRTAVVVENVALYENIYDNLFSTLYAFVEAIEAKDPYTKQHSSRVAEISRIIGKELGCSYEQMDLLHFSGHLHDVGKIGIRDSILLKPGRLTRKEFEVIKQHPVIGENIVSHLGLMSREQKVIRHHHERWDGSGYPDGLKADTIPFLSRILAVADVYDAMASDRAYRPRIPHEIIYETIVKGAGTQFDPRVVEGFVQAYNKKAFAKIDHSKMRIGKNDQPLENSVLQGFSFQMFDPNDSCPPQRSKDLKS